MIHPHTTSTAIILCEHRVRQSIWHGYVVLPHYQQHSLLDYFGGCLWILLCYITCPCNGGAPFGYRAWLSDSRTCNGRKRVVHNTTTIFIRSSLLDRSREKHNLAYITTRVVKSFRQSHTFQRHYYIHVLIAKLSSIICDTVLSHSLTVLSAVSARSLFLSALP